MLREECGTDETPLGHQVSDTRRHCESPSVTAPFNPSAHLHAASRGNVDSLRLLATQGCNLAAANGDHCSMEQGLVFARLAYAHSNLVCDAGLLLSSLAVASAMSPDQDERDSLQAEAIALVSVLADRGEPTCETWLSAMVEDSTAEATEGAKAIRELMLERAG